MSNEPVLIRAAVAAVIGAVVAVLAAFGIVINLSEGQTAAVVGAVSSGVALAAAWFARRKVSPVASG